MDRKLDFELVVCYSGCRVCFCASTDILKDNNFEIFWVDVIALKTSTLNILDFTNSNEVAGGNSGHGSFGHKLHSRLLRADNIRQDLVVLSAAVCNSLLADAILIWACHVY